MTLETWALPGAAVSALDWSIDVPNGIKAKVEKGWITLEGPVEWQFQKAAAERAVRYLSGVKGIKACCRPSAHAADVATRRPPPA